MRNAIHTALFTAAVFAAGIIAGSARAEFSIAYTVEIEETPRVAYNELLDEYLVVYTFLEADGRRSLAVQRVDSNGGLIGARLFPMGSGTHNAIGRPDVAFSPTSNRYVVAVPHNYGPAPDQNGVLVTSFSGDFSSFDFIREVFFGSEIYNASGAAPVRVTWNRIDDEFLISLQRTTYDIYSDPHNGIWTLRYSPASGALAPEVQVADWGPNGFDSHDVERGEYIVSWPFPLPPVYATRYLLAIGASNISLSHLDGYGNYWQSIPFDSGVDYGASQPSIALGRPAGAARDHWLVVWSDENNVCMEGNHAYVQSCPPNNEWTGVWGSYFDPDRVSYGPGPDNAVFPISKIDTHLGDRRTYMPEVSYSANERSFYVAWRERPFQDPANDESRSHVRGNYVDRFVSSEPSPGPHANRVLSAVQGPACAPGVLCDSLEDPRFPAVAAGSTGALVVWQENYPYGVTDQDVFGTVFRAPADSDGDGVRDPEDNCPLIDNPDQTDTDANGIGNACECGDQNGDGRIDLFDLFAINDAILDPGQVTPLCDTNGDGACNLLDLFGVNDRILGESAVCAARPDGFFAMSAPGQEHDLRYVGDAVALGTRIQLTDTATLGQAGAAWHKRQQSLTAGFYTRFVFQAPASTGGGADGFAFVMQAQAKDAPPIGGSPGYPLLDPAVAIAFDFWQNAHLSDPDDNHVEVMACTQPLDSDHLGPCNAYTASLAPYGITLKDGNAHEIEIAYDGSTLFVYVDNRDHTAPLVQLTIDLAQYLGGSDAWIGFTAGTGGSTLNHEILEWDFAVGVPLL